MYNRIVDKQIVVRLCRGHQPFSFNYYQGLKPVVTHSILVKSLSQKATTTKIYIGVETTNVAQVHIGKFFFENFENAIFKFQNSETKF
jgi:hypothetical protein